MIGRIVLHLGPLDVHYVRNWLSIRRLSWRSARYAKSRKFFHAFASLMSVPRPATFVLIVTAPRWPADMIISASLKWFFSHLILRANSFCAITCWKQFTCFNGNRTVKLVDLLPWRCLISWTTARNYYVMMGRLNPVLHRYEWTVLLNCNNVHVVDFSKFFTLQSSQYLSSLTIYDTYR